jgi:hypothetical protein
MARREKEGGPVKPSEGREEISRRKFIQTAEVAAISLFGVLGLDEVIEAVVNHMAEIKGIDRIADRVAKDLRGSGAAYAEDCY